MPLALPNAIRERCVRFVNAGNSRHAAARKFDVSPSFVINLMRLWRETGGVDPRPTGGFRHGKLRPHKVFILREVEKRGDITMPELARVLHEAKGMQVDPATLSRFLIACGLSRRKNTSRIRTRPA